MRLYCHYIPSALFCSLLFHFMPCCRISFAAACCLNRILYRNVWGKEGEDNYNISSLSFYTFQPYFCLCLVFHFLSSFASCSSTHFPPLSHPICWIFDRLRQQEEINTHFFINHTFPSSLAICPSTTSDPASQSSFLVSPHTDGRGPRAASPSSDS